MPVPPIPHDPSCGDCGHPFHRYLLCDATTCTCPSHFPPGIYTEESS